MDLNQWLERCVVSTTIFSNGLAYWPSAKAVRGHGGASCAELCTEFPFLGQHIHDDVAERRALGTLTPDGRDCSLPAVTVTRTAALDIRLREAMIPGSTLPDLPWPAGFNPTVEQLMRWVRTREGMPMLSGWNKPAILKAVKDKITVEMGMKARGEHVPLRDPDGRSLIDHIVHTAGQNS